MIVGFESQALVLQRAPVKHISRGAPPKWDSTKGIQSCFDESYKG